VVKPVRAALGCAGTTGAGFISNGNVQNRPGNIGEAPAVADCNLGEILLSCACNCGDSEQEAIRRITFRANGCEAACIGTAPGRQCTARCLSGAVGK
jgi:hypothetical protein